MAEVSDTSDTGDTASPSGAGDKNDSASPRSPGDPSILVSESTIEDDAEALSELDEISAALVEPPRNAPEATVSAAAASVTRSKSGNKSQEKANLEGVKALVGTVISGRYKVEEVLAAGGMGCVYRGEHVHMHKRVAIKVLLPGTERLPELVQRFKREAVAGAHIDHPNIATATDFGMLDDGSFFLILQFVRGVTLHDVIRRGPLPAPRAAHITRQIASALDACHRMGIIHRDLKPRNIMVEEDRDDFVKLIDFGFAKVPMDRIATIERKGSLKDLKVTAIGTIFGTPSYMAPEIALGMDAVNERSDLYALGVIVYEMLAGAHPFDTKNPSELLIKHRTEPPPPIAKRTGVEVPSAMEAIAMRLLQKDPGLRFPTAAAVVEAIDEAMPGALPARAPQPTHPQLTPISSPQASSQPSQPEAPPSPTEPSAANDLAAAANEAPAPAAEAPKAASKPVENRTRTAAAAAPKTAVPRWALPAALVSLLAALGFLVYALRGGNFAAPAAPTTINAMNAPPAPKAPAVVATPAPSTAPPPSAKPQEPPGDADVGPLRARMHDAANAKKWGPGAEALLEIAERAPKSFEDRDTARAAVSIAAGLAGSGKDRENTDKVFDALENKLGSAGLDILYDIVSTRGTSKASTLATEILRDKHVLERASPALRIAIELRDAPSCQERLMLLDRAKKDGDTRAAAVLEILRAQRCIKGAGECCYRTNSVVGDTIKQIWAKSRSAPAQ